MSGRRLEEQPWRLQECNAEGVPGEARLHHALTPRSTSSTAHFHLDLGFQCRRHTPESVCRETAEGRPLELPENDIWILSDGSAEAGVSNGGGSAFVR